MLDCGPLVFCPRPTRLVAGLEGAMALPNIQPFREATSSCIQQEELMIDPAAMSAAVLSFVAMDHSKSILQAMALYPISTAHWDPTKTWLKRWGLLAHQNTHTGSTLSSSNTRDFATLAAVANENPRGSD